MALTNTLGHIMDQQTSDDLLIIGRVIDIAKQHSCEVSGFNLEEFNFDIVGPNPEKEKECLQALSEWSKKIIEMVKR